MKELLERHSQRITRKIEILQAKSNTLSKWRFIVFAIAIVFGSFGINNLNDYLYVVTLAGIIITFLFLVSRQRKVTNALEKFGYLKEIKDGHIARINLDWDNMDAPFIPDVSKHHPFADDLNIVGKFSIHHLINTAIYTGGAQLLSDWLLKEEPVAQQILARQELIKSLKPLQLFRDKLRVVALHTKTRSSKGDWTMEQMLQWLALPQKTGFKLPLIALTILAISNISFGVLALLGVMSSLPLIISLLIYVSVYKLNSHKVSGLFDASFQMDRLLGRFSAILLNVEKFTFRKDNLLNNFLKVFYQEEEKPSTYLKKIKSLAGAASLQKNQILWPIVNLLMPWDFYYAMRLEQLKHDLEPKLKLWLDKFYQLEALNSLANFAELNPNYTFPTFEQREQESLDAIELGHPLIPSSKKVTNSFRVERGRDLFLLTGSNMAGKSTFLRTVGINLVLAYSGAPVNAKSFNSDFFRIFTSINVVDSLGDGLSHFYAEVKRLRQLLDALNQTHQLPLFFFVDEIYKGTNNRERYAGSAAFLKEVAGKNGAGMVSTHDLELASMEEVIPQLGNWHFSELIKDGKMSFEYKLKSGPCPSTNALQIMKIEGLPVE